MLEENHQIWGGRKDRRLNYREKFWVDGGNQIWRNCYECEEKESSRWWEQLQQNYENQSYSFTFTDDAIFHSNIFYRLVDHAHMCIGRWQFLGIIC